MSQSQIQSLVKNIQKDLKDGNVQNAIQKFNTIRQSHYCVYQTKILGKKLIDANGNKRVIDLISPFLNDQK